MSSLRFVYSMALVGVVILVECDSAMGQSVRRSGNIRRYQGMSEPFVSPYLRLVQPGSQPGLNYFNLVQPQLQMMENTRLNATRIQGLNRDLQQQVKETAYGRQLGIRATGGVSSHGNYSHFYPSKGGGGAAVRQLRAPSSGGGMGGMGMF